MSSRTHGKLPHGTASIGVAALVVLFAEARVSLGREQPSIGAEQPRFGLHGVSRQLYERFNSAGNQATIRPKS